MIKNIFCSILVFLAAAAFAEGIAEEAARGNFKADMSYAFGMAIADDLQQTGLEFNYGAFMRGFRDVMENQETRMSLDVAFDIVDEAIQTAMSNQAEIYYRNEAEFLARNSAKPGINVTNSGLQYEIIAEGSGKQPSIYDTVLVHYTGFLTDGTVFDTSYDGINEPVEFPLRGVIPGWSEGLQLMREGGKSRFYIPSNLAYGSQGIGGIIPPFSVLVFEVELIEITDSD